MKLDWKNDADYEYTRDLTDLGWAWEFIRRNPAYRAAYQKICNLIANECGGAWDAQPLRYYPERMPNETVNAWKVRSDELGLIPRRQSPSKSAALEWSLPDMYDPTTIYNSKTIKIRHAASPYPAYFGAAFSARENEITEAEQIKIAKIVKKHPILNKLRPFDEIQAPSGVELDENIVLVAIDVRQSIKAQTAQASKFLTAYAKTVKGTTLHRMKFRPYLRCLDAVDSGAGMTRIEMMKLIDPNHNAGDDDAIGKYFDDTLNQAIAVRDQGYRSLLVERKT